MNTHTHTHTETSTHTFSFRNNTGLQHTTMPEKNMDLTQINTHNTQKNKTKCNVTS